MSGVWAWAVGAVEAAMAQDVPLDVGVTVRLSPPGVRAELFTNAAQRLARAAGLAPAVLAERVRGRLARTQGVILAEAADSGFVNFSLEPALWQAEVPRLLSLPPPLPVLASTDARFAAAAASLGSMPARFWVQATKAGQEIDSALAQDPAWANLYFRVQYTHARCCSVLRTWQALTPLPIPVEALTAAEELALIRVLAVWPATATAGDSYRLAWYLTEVADAFALLFEARPGIVTLPVLSAGLGPALRARLGLVQAVARVIGFGLSMMGVDPVEELRA